MKTDKLLDDLENVIASGSRVPFSNKRMVEEEEVMQILDAIKESLPLEVEESRKVIADREKILAEAQRHADSMVAQAKDYIAKLTEESELVRQSQEQANQIITYANQSSEELKNSSIVYAGDVLKYVEGNLEKTLESIRQNRESLLNNNKK
jgi:cell division septum initiation protein DivIVA